MIGRSSIIACDQLFKSDDIQMRRPSFRFTHTKEVQLVDWNVVVSSMETLNGPNICGCSMTLHPKPTATS